MEHRIIATWGNPRQVVYRAGSDGPVLVWLHSLYGVEADAPVVERLAKDHQVYAPLAPGFADLDELDNIRDIHDLALHYDDILQALDLANVLLAGHSFGAMIAAELAAHVPSRVSGLVLASPLGLWNDDYPVSDIFGVPPAEMPTLLYADPTRAPGGPEKPDVAATIALARGMATVARFLWPIPDRGLWRRLHRIGARTLVIHGAADRFVPVQYAYDFASALPGADTAILEGLGHMVFTDGLDASLAAVQRFLSPVEVEARA